MLLKNTSVRVLFLLKLCPNSWNMNSCTDPFQRLCRHFDKSCLPGQLRIAVSVKITTFLVRLLSRLTRRSFQYSSVNLDNAKEFHISMGSGWSNNNINAILYLCIYMGFEQYCVSTAAKGHARKIFSVGKNTSRLSEATIICVILYFPVHCKIFRNNI